MKSIFENKPQLIVLILVSLVVAVVSSPFWLWYLKPEKTLDLLIVDKTVPDKSFREHKGLTWILNNEKYRKSNGSPYSAEDDYIGFEHEKAKSYTAGKLPDDLDPYKVVYLADLYGVYEEEFHGPNESGSRSKQLYGGLQQEDVTTLENALLEGNKTLIAEFNTFGSPTEEAVRKQMTNLLNVKWSGWTGRYFPDLDGKEVPQWIIDQYKVQTGGWNFTGAGFVFVNEENFIVVIGKEDIVGEGLEFLLTQKGEKTFNSDLNSKYTYWFDIIEPIDECEVLANYQLPVKAQAIEKLASYGIPLAFPAVIHHKNKLYSSYYFAGDYADEAEVPEIYQTEGLSTWRKITGGRNSFYWSTYVPMMKEILAEGLHKQLKNHMPEMAVAERVQYNSKTNSDSIQIQKDGKWEKILIKGVNIGMGKPGAFPGEAAITKEEYLRWLKLIGGMNANAIRIYTLHPPAFYEALYEYNQMAEKPIYLFHGAWVNEENFVGSQDAFSRNVMDDFKRELKQMVDIVHGNADIKPTPGHASGVYQYDISPYVLGFIIGTEWDPGAVLNTNNVHKGMDQLSGRYFTTKDADPFEVWLARMMDFTAGYETTQYGWQHTLSFTNWVTTDLLDHPSEPLETEDMVSVNPNHIEKTKRFNAGMFASYHIYPYYPDFLNYEKKYLEYKDGKGTPNHYAGYLHELISAHTMPVLVAEFGVPSSRGLTHRNISGMNQGFLTEKQQGEMNSKMFNSIVEEGYAGGIVFAWQDEWFKRTWNTMDYDNPHRRPYWANRQTNEQNFGLMSFEPGKRSSSIFVDGRIEDWDKKAIQPLAKSSKGDLRQLFAASDAAHLYLRLDFSKPLDWKKQSHYVFLDTMPEQGQQQLKLKNGINLKADFGVDFVIELAGPDQSKLLVDSYYDPYYFQYGKTLKMIPEQKYAERNNNGIFHPIMLTLNKEMTLPGENGKIPFESYETGILKYGTANPSDEKFDSLTDISISDDRKTVEIRIPWQLLNVKDPSAREIMGNLYESGLTGSVKIEGIHITAAAIVGGNVTSILPNNDSGILKNSVRYIWEEWEQPQFYEREKNSYGIMKETFKNARSKGDNQ
ncbi:hypothetical protein V7201_20970 [Bacillus sp. JJ1122]|uniref:hypothetical protein n=1 Tax=Bacillus sp. JJ1122 TaxID=3122951 RepID=UPI002FFDBB59